MSLITSHFSIVTSKEERAESASQTTADSPEQDALVDGGFASRMHQSRPFDDIVRPLAHLEKLARI